MRSLNKSICKHLLGLQAELKGKKMFPVVNIQKLSEIIGVSQQTMFAWKKLGFLDCTELSRKTHVYDLRKNINKLLTHCRDIEQRGTIKYEQITIKEVYEDGSEHETTYVDEIE